MQTIYGIVAAIVILVAFSQVGERISTRQFWIILLAVAAIGWVLIGPFPFDTDMFR